MSFYKYLLCLAIILVFAHKAIAQYPKDTLAFHISSGSAKALRGKVHVVNVFISDDRKGWDKEEKLSVLKGQDYGLKWVQRQVRNYLPESDLEFAVSTLGLEKDIKTDKIYSSIDPHVDVSVSAWALYWAGYSSTQHFYDSIKAIDNADNVLVMLFANKTGRGYAQPSGTSNSESPWFLEGTMMYANNYDGSGLSIGTIVHEMLHLFGAWDIYNSNLQTAEVERNSRNIFPNSIMLQSHDLITQLTIDKLTAWCVGITDKYFGWYDFFKPRVNKRTYKIIEPQKKEKKG
jgi:hypothetical protein